MDRFRKPLFRSPDLSDAEQVVREEKRREDDALRRRVIRRPRSAPIDVPRVRLRTASTRTRAGVL